MPNRHKKPTNLIDYQPCWTDQFGLMGDAVQWAEENLEPGQTVQGVRYFNGAIDRFEITRNEVRRRRNTTQIHIRLDQRNPAQRVDIRDNMMQVWSKNADYGQANQVYKRFIVNGKPEWRLVSELKMVNINPDHCPMYMPEYVTNLTRMINDWWRGNTDEGYELPVDFTCLVLRIPQGLSKDRLHDLAHYTGVLVNHDQFVLYSKIRSHLMTFSRSRTMGMRPEEQLPVILDFAYDVGQTLMGEGQTERDWFDERHWLQAILSELKLVDDEDTTTFASPEHRQAMGKILFHYLDKRLQQNSQVQKQLLGMIAQSGLQDLLLKYQ